MMQMCPNIFMGFGGRFVCSMPATWVDTCVLNEGEPWAVDLLEEMRSRESLDNKCLVCSDPWVERR